MKDFNFFDPYIVEPEKTSPRRLLYLVLGTVVLFGLVVYPALRYAEQRTLLHDKAILQDELDMINQSGKLEIVAEKQRKLEALEAELANLQQVSSQIEKASLVNEDLLRLIARRSHPGIMFESVNMIGNQVQVQGNATHKIAIAQMEHNIRTTPSFSNVFIPFIAERDTLYQFSMSFQVEEVLPVENQ